MENVYRLFVLGGIWGLLFLFQTGVCSAQNNFDGDWIVNYWEYEYHKIQKHKKDSALAAIMTMPVDSLPKGYDIFKQFDQKPKSEDFFDKLYDFFAIHIEGEEAYLQPFHQEKIPLTFDQTAGDFNLYKDSIHIRMTPIDSSNITIFSGKKGDNLKELRLNKLSKGEYDETALLDLQAQIEKHDWEVKRSDIRTLVPFAKERPAQFNLINGNIIIGRGEAGVLGTQVLILKEIASDCIKFEASHSARLIPLGGTLRAHKYKPLELRKAPK